MAYGQAGHSILGTESTDLTRIRATDLKDISLLSNVWLTHLETHSFPDKDI